MNDPSRVTLAVPPKPGDHVRGNPQARVHVVEFGDFECPNCKMAEQASTLLLERFPDQVSFVFRHFPLEAAHPHALMAAEAAEAAGAQEAFWPMHDLLFAHQAQLESADLERYAGEAGLDVARFKADLAAHRHLPKVREHIDAGRSSHIRATPTFFIDGVVQDVSFGLQALHDAVARAVEQSR